MTTAAQLRKTAERHAGVRTEGTSYVVEGVTIASLDDDGRLHLHLPAAEATDMASQHDDAEVLDDGVRVPIANVGGQGLNYWVQRAWLHAIPADLAERSRAAAGVEPGEVGDLPAAIGRPATRALAGAGIRTLTQVGSMSDAELLALHGVGPKAVRLLREAIAG